MTELPVLLIVGHLTTGMDLISIAQIYSVYFLIAFVFLLYYNLLARVVPMQVLRVFAHLRQHLSAIEATRLILNLDPLMVTTRMHRRSAHLPDPFLLPLLRATQFLRN